MGAVGTDWQLGGFAVDPLAVRARSYNIKAWNELISKRPANGLADAEQAVALAPNDAGIIDTRGQIYTALGHWAEAIADLDKPIAGGVSGASTFTARATRTRRAATETRPSPTIAWR